MTNIVQELVEREYAYGFSTDRLAHRRTGR